MPNARREYHFNCPAVTNRRYAVSLRKLTRHMGISHNLEPPPPPLFPFFPCNCPRIIQMMPSAESVRPSDIVGGVDVPNGRTPQRAETTYRRRENLMHGIAKISVSENILSLSFINVKDL